MPRKKKTEEEKKVEIKEIKEESKEEKKEAKPEHEEIKVDQNLLVPIEYYIKTAVHLGTRAVTPDMREYMYKRRADGIAVLNTNKINEKIEIAAKFLAQFSPEKIVFCCKRENCERIVENFGKVTGIKVFTKYPAGSITNSAISDFFEPNAMFISDPWLDKNALKDAVSAKIPLMALCSTNNLTRYVDIIVPCNNKSYKSIGLVLYLIAKIFLEQRGIKKEVNISDFCEIEEKKDLELDEARKLIKIKLEEMKKKKEEKVV